MTNENNSAVSELHSRSVASTALNERKACIARTTEMHRLNGAPLRRWPMRSSISRLGVVILGGVLLASCGSSVNDVGATPAALTSGEAEKDAARLSLQERLDHTVVNQHSTAHDSDAPGASVASY